MQSLLDKHCPEVRVRRKPSKLTPWFDAECVPELWSAGTGEHANKLTGWRGENS